MLRKDQTTIGIDEGEEFKANGIDQSFTKIMMIRKQQHKLRKDTPMQIEGMCRTPNRQAQDRKSLKYIIVYTLSIQNE